MKQVFGLPFMWWRKPSIRKSIENLMNCVSGLNDEEIQVLEKVIGRLMVVVSSFDEDSECMFHGNMLWNERMKIVNACFHGN